MSERKRTFKWLYFVVFVLVTIYPMYALCWDGLLEEYIQQMNGMDNFCISLGHNKSTDYNPIGNSPIFVDGYNVECDKSFIYNWNMHEICIKTNKWGECLEEDYLVNVEKKEARG